MSNIEKIRQEIERRRDELERDKYINIDAKTCRQSELKYLERFIDSLPEEKPSEDLEEAAKEYTQEMLESWKFDSTGVRPIREPFIAGAEWQKEHSFKPTQEQLNALDTVYKTHGADGACRHVILNLLNQLKEL